MTDQAEIEALQNENDRLRDLIADLECTCDELTQQLDRIRIHVYYLSRM